MAGPKTVPGFAMLVGIPLPEHLIEQSVCCELVLTLVFIFKLEY